MGKLCCSSSRTSSEPPSYISDPLEAPEDFEGPAQTRQCTDIFCLLLIIVMWISMTAIGAYSIKNGDYRLLLHPIDYDGNICGLDNTKRGGIDMTDYAYLYPVNVYTGGVCVESCGLPNDQAIDPTSLVTYGGLFEVEDYYEEFTSNIDNIVRASSIGTDSSINVANYTGVEDALFCTVDTCFPNSTDARVTWTSEGVNEGRGYAMYAVDTADFYQYCVPTTRAIQGLENITMEETTFTQVTTFLEQAAAPTSTLWSNLMHDFWNAKFYILTFGFGLATIVGFFYVMFLRLPFLLSFVVWSSILVSISLFFVGGYYTYQLSVLWKAQEPALHTLNEMLAAEYSSYALWGVGGILVLLLCYLRTAIQLALGCVREASKAMVDIGSVVVLPLAQTAGMFGFFVVWMVYAIHLASLGEYELYEFEWNDVTVAVRYFSYDDTTKYVAWYLFFCFLWTYQFIRAMGEITVSMCFSSWYFSRKKSNMGCCVALRCCQSAMWYHAGSAAFGSFIIAVIQLIRAMMAYAQKKAKELDNRAGEALLCVFQCLFWCFEKCIQFLNKNAYIQIALFGDHFCKAARESFGLIIRNAERVGAVTYISFSVIFVGRLFISSVTGFISYYVMSESTISTQLYSLVGPVLMVFALAFGVSGVFMSIFDMGINTIVHCFIADEEMFDNHDDRYARGSLKKWVNNHGSEGKRQVIAMD